MKIHEIQYIIEEAASIISGIENPEAIEGFRYPIVDELQGLALMLPEIFEAEVSKLRTALNAAIDLLDDSGDGTINDKLSRWSEARASLELNARHEPQALT